MQERYNSQKEDGLIDDNHRAKRNLCRIVGPVCLGIGVLLVVIAFVDFFMAFGGMGKPNLFWCFFLAMPLLFVGSILCQAGYGGAVARYMASEMAPVAKDTTNYMVDGTAPAVEKLAGAVGRGLGDALSGVIHAGPGQQCHSIRCQKCNHVNDSDAKFCNNCGYNLQNNRLCPACGEQNPPDAKFCDNCGRQIIR